jgi:hypothetical protein
VKSEVGIVPAGISIRQVGHVATAFVRFSSKADLEKSRAFLEEYDRFEDKRSHDFLFVRGLSPLASDMDVRMVFQNVDKIIFRFDSRGKRTGEAFIQITDSKYRESVLKNQTLSASLPLEVSETSEMQVQSAIDQNLQAISDCTFFRMQTFPIGVDESDVRNFLNGIEITSITFEQDPLGWRNGNIFITVPKSERERVLSRSLSQFRDSYIDIVESNPVEMEEMLYQSGRFCFPRKPTVFIRDLPKKYSSDLIRLVLKREDVHVDHISVRSHKYTEALIELDSASEAEKLESRLNRAVFGRPILEEQFECDSGASLFTIPALS